MASLSGPGALELLGAGTSFQREMCNLLAESRIFNDLEWSEIDLLSRFMQAYRANEGTVIFREGELGDCLCLILAGQVEIHKGDQHDEDRVVAVVGPGKTLGEMSVIDGERRSASCVARSDTTLTLLTKGNFEKLLQEHPALGVKILTKIARLLSQRLRSACGQLVDYLGE
jgi:CRP-like cAMP-binding protein